MADGILFIIVIYVPLSGIISLVSIHSSLLCLQIFQTFFIKKTGNNKGGKVFANGMDFGMEKEGGKDFRKEEKH